VEAKTKVTITNTEVSIPVWVLQAKVESDYEEWVMFTKPSRIIEDDFYTEEMRDQEESRPEFPEYDSTCKAIEVLAAHGVHFHPLTGKWSYDAVN